MPRGHEERIKRMRSLAEHADQVRSKADEIRLQAAQQLEQSRDRDRTISTASARPAPAGAKPKHRQ
jgi:hypothetical protein